VNQRYGELFAGDESLSSRFGSLVFTGVEDDPETLVTLARMGFSQPLVVSGLIRSWHHGRIPATRTPRGRELFTRLAPRLLEAARATGAPEAAFNRFADFFTALSSGVQVQALFLAQPRLLGLLVEVLAFAPRLAFTLARQPAALDAMLDARFLGPFDVDEIRMALLEGVAGAPSFEGAMDAARRIHREEMFRIGVRILSGTVDAAAAGEALAGLADACIGSLAPAAQRETERVAGVFPGAVAIVALGKAGSRELTVGSDLDLMTLYEADGPDAASRLKGWSAETFFARFTQRLVSALSAPTPEGAPYKVDLQLRPSGTSGPVAVSMAAFEDYYAKDAETWEFLALTRARCVWASTSAFAARVDAAVERALRRPRSLRRTSADVLAMRALMRKERPAQGPWDLKLTAGGLVDIEFAAQFLQLVAAANGGPLKTNTADALEALAAAGAADPSLLRALHDAWRLQQDLSQVLRLAFDGPQDPADEPLPFRRLLAKAAGFRSWPMLRAELRRSQDTARAAFASVLRAPGALSDVSGR
jgi:glutamate-ammonia-ligase adenylyltransferase